MEENTTIVVEESTTGSEDFFAGLAGGFQSIVDLILKIINSIREVIESIINGAK